MPATQILNYLACLLFSDITPMNLSSVQLSQSAMRNFFWSVNTQSMIMCNLSFAVTITLRLSSTEFTPLFIPNAQNGSICAILDQGAYGFYVSSVSGVFTTNSSLWQFNVSESKCSYVPINLTFISLTQSNACMQYMYRASSNH